MDLPSAGHTLPLYVTDSRSGSRSTSANSPQSACTPVGQPRLANVNEAYLLRHFQRHLAPWVSSASLCMSYACLHIAQFDAGDPEHQFATHVASRASQHPLLLYACLAVSACHLSRTANTISPDVADSYHERCVSIMLPSLDKPNFDIGIDILLSSTVILRFFEQISCTSTYPSLSNPLIPRSAHTPSNDPQRHLLAGSVYISSHVDCAISVGLASASFWVFVIQDIQFALTYQKCLRLTFAPFDDRLRRWWNAKPILSDGDWVNRAIWLLAETIDYCYNISGRNYSAHLGASGEHALKQRIADWEIQRPETFTPLHVSPPDHGRGKPFPVVWYTSLWHCMSPRDCVSFGTNYVIATAMQHVCLAKALMLIREFEVYNNIHPDQQANLKVCHSHVHQEFRSQKADENLREPVLPLRHCFLRRRRTLLTNHGLSCYLCL